MNTLDFREIQFSTIDGLKQIWGMVLSGDDLGSAKNSLMLDLLSILYSTVVHNQFNTLVLSVLHPHCLQENEAMLSSP